MKIKILGSKHPIFDSNLDLIKRLYQIKYQRLVLTRAPSSEHPSNTRSMVPARNGRALLSQPLMGSPYPLTGSRKCRFIMGHAVAAADWYLDNPFGFGRLLEQRALRGG